VAEPAPRLLGSFARRSAARMAGPATTMPTTLVTARSVSQVRVDVIRE